MTDRPAARVLESLISEEWRGRPGPARDLALQCAEQDPGNRVHHIMDATYASLVAGEPRFAMRLLDRIRDAATSSDVQRRVTACQAWAQQLDDNWYPGNAGAEFRPGALERLAHTVTPAPGESETMLLEACVAYGPVSFPTMRNLIEEYARTTPQAVSGMLASALRSIDQFREVANTLGSVTNNLWGMLAAADFAARAGFITEASRNLSATRDVYEELQDRVGMANSYLIGGDWWATPESSPEALGFDLAAMAAAPHADRRDAAKAGALYRRAGALLQGVDAPRCIGALALRRAALAWRTRQFEQQIAWLDTANDAFTDSGDAALRHLTVVHRLLADVARGEFTGARRAAPTEWAAAPGGPIGRLVEWAREQGSVSFCGGLGRLLQRAAQHWVQENELERAEHALLMALPLLSLSEIVPKWTVLGALSDVDLKRNIPVRPLVRCLGALAQMGEGPADDAMPWLQRLELTMSLVAIPSGMAPSSSTAIVALERGVKLLTTLLRAAPLDTITTLAAPAPDLNAVLEELRQKQADRTLEELAEEAKAGGPQALERQMVGVAARVAVGQIATAQALAALNRARRAEREGWEPDADRWYEEAMRRVESVGDGTLAWLGVLILAAWGKRDEALARFEHLRAGDGLKPSMLAPLALRAGAPEVANRLFTDIDADRAGTTPLGMGELSDRAEAALGDADPQRALDFAQRAIALFEAGVARLSRDSDRIAATDDVSAASVYQYASRACLALGDDPAQSEQRSRWYRESFDCCERARSLTFRILMDELTMFGASTEPRSRRLHQAATEQTTTYQRLLAAHQRNELKDIRQREEELAAGEAALADIEAEMAPLYRARAVAAPVPALRVTAEEIQRLLSPGACLLAYHIVGRDLVGWAVSADSVDALHTRFPRHVLAGQVNRLLRACAAGDPGDEAAALSGILLEPYGKVLERHQRVVVVPSGPLNGLPFHVLPFAGQPLGATHVMSYLPAASLLAQTPLDDPLSGYGAVVVGDPAFNEDAHPTLRRLPGAGVEAAAIGQLHRARDVLVDAAATEERLRPLLQGRAVVHLAAHGYLDEIAPNSSAIVLAGSDRLTVGDLVGLRVDAGLAVLSACDTGQGAAMLGGDVVGLVRGLLAAGVRRSVVSLWPVDDAVACVTMVGFHEELVKGEPPAAALASAQRRVRGMTGAQIAARYRDLGGEINPGGRSVRRGATVAKGPALAIPLDPEFIDADDPSSDTADVLDGRLACAWAPFVLVGP